ncbi:MAG: hypothetical protein U0X91_23825 [Spirosomataceae bacterium]
MSKKIVERIQKEVNIPHLAQFLAAMPSPDLNSLLMKVMRTKTERLSLGGLM